MIKIRDKHIMKFIDWIADYTLAPKGLVLKLFIVNQNIVSHKIKDKEKQLKKTPLRKPKEPESDTKPENDRIKRLKELAELNKMGILSTAEFEKLKADLIN